MVKQLPVVWTEKNNCQDCYKCLRECTVKAIKIEDASASIIDDLCIYCGHCVQICPSGAKKTRNDVPKALSLIRTGAKVIVSLAPSYLTEFPGVSSGQLIAAFKQAGFYGVSETALGAEKSAAETRSWLEAQPAGAYLGSSCPSSVEYVGKYYPELLSRLAPIHSPMACHGAMLKAHYGAEVKVVFVGPCFAKKTEADLYSDKIDCAMTYVGLQKMFDSLGIDPSFCQPTAEDVFIPHLSRRGDLFPVDGGMLMNMRSDIGAADVAHMSFSGIRAVHDVLQDFDRLPSDRKLFVETMICEGGCIEGPARLVKESIAAKRLKIIANNAEKTDVAHCDAFDEAAKPLDYSRRYDHLHASISCTLSEEDVQQQLRGLNKFSERDELNCGGCGYDDCRTLAKAILNGFAERQMCVAYMRGVANDKASVLLQKIPSGVVIVDEDMKIVDCNAKFASLCGDEVTLIYEANPGMAGADLTKLIHSHKFFSTVLNTGDDMVEQDIRDGDMYYNISIVSIQQHKLVMGIVQNLREPEVQKDIVLSRTRDVILENMKVVQQIAYLLGENASFTESMLNSIVESHDKEKG